jgi:hypothetical protein
MKAYYAHCKAIYGTPQERRDVAQIQQLGFEVVNPAEAEWDALWKERGMEAKQDFAIMCDVIIFRALPDGRIPQGVFKEIREFQLRGKPVFELPSMIVSRELSLQATRDYMAEVGQR